MKITMKLLSIKDTLQSLQARNPLTAYKLKTSAALTMRKRKQRLLVPAKLRRVHRPRRSRRRRGHRRPRRNASFRAAQKIPPSHAKPRGFRVKTRRGRGSLSSNGIASRPLGRRGKIRTRIKNPIKLGALRRLKIPARFNPSSLRSIYQARLK